VNALDLSVLSHPLAKVKVSDLRNTLTRAEQFRKSLNDLTTILAIYATQDLETIRNEVETPLERTEGHILKGDIALAPVLRAGLGMVDSFLNLIPTAVVSHIGLERDEQSLEPRVYYSGSQLRGISRCYVLDPMLATGGSAVEACSIVKQWDVNQIVYIGIIGTTEGIDNLSRAHPDIQIHLAAVDETLNDLGYISPGLGDAGDRQYGAPNANNET
jgi:uracil phosphoribosyltransferase